VRWVQLSRGFDVGYPQIIPQQNEWKSRIDNI